MATIYKIWMMRHVDVPHEVARALAGQMGSGGRARAERKDARLRKPTKPKYIPVVAIVNGSRDWYERGMAAPLDPVKRRWR